MNAAAAVIVYALVAAGYLAVACLAGCLLRRAAEERERQAAAQRERARQARLEERRQRTAAAVEAARKRLREKGRAA